jgi:hypothetical protein
MHAIPAVNPHDRGFIAVSVGIRRWPAECLLPVRGKALGVVRMEATAERMANLFVLQRPHVPRVRQPPHPLATTYSFKGEQKSQGQRSGSLYLDGHRNASDR